MSEAKGDDDLGVFDDLIGRKESSDSNAPKTEAAAPEPRSDALPPRPMVRHSLAPPSVPLSRTLPGVPSRRSSAPSSERLTGRSSSVPPMPVSRLGLPPPPPPRDVRTLPGLGTRDTAPPSAASVPSPLELGGAQPSLEAEIKARKRTRAKQIAGAFALVGMFLAGYVARGKGSGEKTSASKEDTASLRTTVHGDGVAAQPVTTPPPRAPEVVVAEPSKEAEPSPIAEDRTADVPAVEKKRGRAVKATVAAAKPTATAADAPDQPVAAPAEKAAAGGRDTCTLGINSIPISRVAVDGQPVGLTPALGVSVSAGTHNVLLVTDTMRKTITATCKAGEKKTISLRMTP